MLIAPLIHTRTFRCDFNEDFLARPDDFKTDDIMWAKEKIQAATADVDSLRGRHWLIAAKKGRLIAGAVFASTRELAASVGADTADGPFRDEAGRSILAFIGVSIQVENAGKEALPDLSDAYLYGLFRQYVEPVFYKQSIASGAYKHDKARLPDNLTPDFKTERRRPDAWFEKTELYESSPDDDRRLFYSYLQEQIAGKGRGEFCFCSNISRYQDVQKMQFQAVTASGAVIRRVEDNPAPERVREPSPDVQAEAVVNDAKKKQKRRITWRLALSIVFLLLLLLVAAKIRGA